MIQHLIHDHTAGHNSVNGDAEFSTFSELLTI